MIISQSDLNQFTGTQAYYYVFGKKITDGVKYLMENGAGWLVTDILSYQVETDVQKIPFQIWELHVFLDKTAILTMAEDVGKPIIVKEKYNYTDFPLPYIKLYFVDGVLLLPSEY